MKKILVLFIIVFSVNCLIADIVFDVPFDPDMVGDPFVGEDYTYESPSFFIVNNGAADTFTIATSNGIVPDGWYWIYCEVDGGLCHQPGWPFDILLESGEEVELNIHVHVTSIGSLSMNFTVGAPSVPDSVSMDFTFQTENQSTGEEQFQVPIPRLKNNSPNPFKNTTTINYDIPASYQNDLAVAIYNIIGQPVKTYHNLENSGSITWDGTNENGKSLASGVYFYKFIGEKQAESKKLLLIR